VIECKRIVRCLFFLSYYCFDGQMAEIIIGRILTGHNPMKVIQVVESPIDGSLENAKWLSIRAMVWDAIRRILWVLDDIYIRRIDVFSQLSIYDEMITVPLLSSFPPGVLPICISYIPMDGIVTTVQRIGPGNSRCSMGVLRSTGDVFITRDTSTIIHYSSETSRLKWLHPIHTEHLHRSNWHHISPLDIDGRFVLYGGPASIILHWNPITNFSVGSEGIVDASIVESIAYGNGMVYAMHTTLSRVLQRVGQTVTLSFSSANRNSVAKLILPDGHMLHNITDRTIHDGFSVFVPSNGMLHIMTDYEIVSVDNHSVKWKEPGPVSFPNLKIGVACGVCDNQDMVFYCTNNRTVIQYLIVPTDINRSKRRRVES
jgi:hypothetical protein